jgi:methionine-rich copper-binding protein CopC
MTKRHSAWKLVAVAIVLISGAFLLWKLAFAHAELIVAQSDPRPGQVLSQAPTQVTLAFREAEGGIDANRSGIWVYEETTGTIVDLGDLKISAGEGEGLGTMTISLRNAPPLGEGIYIVKWLVVSVEDRGFAEGSFSFAIKSK